MYVALRMVMPTVMNLPLWTLLGFAMWTLYLLLGTVGIYRWSRILSGRVPIRDFRADNVSGRDWYRRAMRAHANCIENLPVYGAVVLVLHVSETSSLVIDSLSVIVLIARICQSVIHVVVNETNTTVSIRFTFFMIQVLCMLWQGLTVVLHTL